VDGRITPAASSFRKGKSETREEFLAPSERLLKFLPFHLHRRASPQRNSHCRSLRSSAGRAHRLRVTPKFALDASRDEPPAKDQ